MSEALANVVADSNDRIKLSFQPEEDGLSSLISAHVPELGNDSLPVTGNAVEFALPRGDAKLFLIFFPGPVPEQGTLLFSVNDGASIELDSDFIANFPNPILLFGK